MIWYLLGAGVAGFVAGFFVCKNNYNSVTKLEAAVREAKSKL